MGALATGTASAAKAFVALTTLLQPTTVSPVLPKLETPTARVHRTNTRQPCASEYESVTMAPGLAPIAVITDLAKGVAIEQPERATTAAEKLIGEIRRWRLLRDNWDGEGAVAPSAAALKQATSFVTLLNEAELPEAMLHGSGHAGLFWKNNSLYADIEFLGGDRLAYYIERDGDKHKGVLNFDNKNMPPVLAALLSA